jgi:hypothetical protein
MAITVPDDALNRRALAAQMGTGGSKAGAVTDTIGSTVADSAGTLAKLFGKGGSFKGGGAGASGIGIAGEILGALLKPKHDQANVGEFGNYLDLFRRREEGSGDGVLGGAAKWGGRGAQIGSFVPGIGTAIGGAIGAAAGAIGNLFTKNAKSAYTDFTEQDARKAIRDIYQQEGGRDVGEDEVTQILVGQGWEPGERWVGEKGMLGVLSNLRGNFAAERTRSAPAADQGSPGVAPAPAFMQRADAIRNMDRDAIIALLGQRG